MPGRSLTSKREAAERAKREGTNKGEQYVGSTEAARETRKGLRQVTSLSMLRRYERRGGQGPARWSLQGEPEEG